MKNRTVLQDFRDPEVLALTCRPQVGKKLFLGLDLGTSCGYSYSFHEPGSPVVPEEVALHMGMWDLSAGPYDSGAIRFVRLRQYLSCLKPDLIFYERVRFTPSITPNRVNIHAIISRAATSMELFGAFFGTLSGWAEENGVPCEGVTIQEIKRRATSRGNSDKSDIIRACNDLFGSELDPEKYETVGHDNVADSAFICLLSLERYGKGIPAVVSPVPAIVPDAAPVVSDAPPVVPERLAIVSSPVAVLEAPRPLPGPSSNGVPQPVERLDGETYPVPDDDDDVDDEEDMPPPRKKRRGDDLEI